jgi:hypothetical protein
MMGNNYQHPKRLGAITAALVIGAICACSSGKKPATSPAADPPAVIVPSAVTMPFAGGTVTSFVTHDGSGVATSIGLRLSPAVLAGVGAVQLTTTLRFATGALPAPFDHIQVDWNPGGHPPHGIYHLPHFDFHFFMISLTERAAISVADGATMFRAPAVAAIPEGYRADTEGFAQMGVHWLDSRAPEFAQQPFTRTMIHGFYDGRMIFQEPMVTKAFLETRPNFDALIAQPAQYPTSGLYPTRYRVTHDAASGDYIVALDGLMPR